MSLQIKNAASRAIILGANDLSAGSLVIDEAPLPTHVPCCFIFAQKGTVAPIVRGNKAEIYGAKTFESTSEYFTHHTELSRRLTGLANSHFTIRLKPTDANPPSGFGLFLDVAVKDIPVYERNADNSIVRDEFGTRVLADPPATVEGLSLMWVVKPIERVNAAGQVINAALIAAHDADPDNVDITPVANRMGEQTVSQGTRTNKDASPSTLYPICDAQAAWFGKAGDWGGIRLWAPTVNDSTALDLNAVETLEAMIYRMSIVTKETAKSTPLVTPTRLGERTVDFTFKPNAVHPTYENDLTPEGVINNGYTENPHFDEMHWYRDNIRTVCGLMKAVEAPLQPTVFTYDATDPDSWFDMNFMSAEDVNGNAYHGIEIDTAGSTFMTETSTIWAEGGSDGDMSDASYNALVRDYANSWGEGDYPLLDMLKYPISDIYDTGFEAATKDALMPLTGKTPMLKVAVGTHIMGEGPLSISEEIAFARSLRLTAQNTPESVYFGTPCSRVTVVAQCGKMADDSLPGYWSQVMDLAIARATDMRSPQLRWSSERNYSKHPNNVVSILKDLSNPYINVPGKEALWEEGVIWAESASETRSFRPAHQTVYPDDTSVLNSLMFSDILSYLNYLSVKVWVKFAGRNDLSDPEFIAAVDNEMASAIEGLFDDRVAEIVPRTEITSADALRRYSWTSTWEVRMAAMKTVARFAVEAYNSNDA